MLYSFILFILIFSFSIIRRESKNRFDIFITFFNAKIAFLRFFYTIIEIAFIDLTFFDAPTFFFTNFFVFTSFFFIFSYSF